MKIFSQRVFGSLCSVLFLFCSQLSLASEFNLQQAEAEDRAKRVSELEYEWTVHLKKSPLEFAGDLQLFFNLNDNSKKLRLDFFKGEISQLILNGAKIKPIYDGKQIELEKELLVVGRNSVRVKYTRSYNRNGTGLSYFKDPKDGRVYLYSQFQTVDANQAFPCFDQPDLKATYKLTVTAPQSWTVVTSVKEKKVRYNRHKERVWHFPESAKFSTYLLSLHAGPYKIWSDKAGRIPLRLMARRSLAKNVRAKDWFKFTKVGFSYFEKEFGYKYPFKKYDQLLVPEFNAGAMENVAAVTFSEKYMTRGKASRSNRRRLAEAVFHEMAHMWFGNLVTMRWWNDLWLNESFATFMSYKALVAKTEYSETWQHFYNGIKSRAYRGDQSVTTHPIESKIVDTKSAVVSFDGITYGKGASVLKQVDFSIGHDAFRKGVRNYFKKYAYKNTTRADFMSELSAASTKDLGGWQKQWLNTSGVNRIKVSPVCKAGALKSLNITQQRDKSSKVLRSHKFKVALLNVKGDKLKVSQQIMVDISGEDKEIKITHKMACPEMIHPNFEDYGYFRAQLDEVTVKNVFSMIPKVKDTFLREMFWASIWGMVREGELSIYRYAELILEQGLEEEDLNILRSLTRKIYSRYPGSSSIEYYLPIGSESEQKIKQTLLKKFEDKVFEKLMQSQAKSDKQLLWFDVYVALAKSADGQQNLASFLAGKRKLKGFVLDQDRRWGLVNLLARRKFSGVEGLVAIEAKRDKSNRGKMSQIAIKVLVSDWKVKQGYIGKVIAEKSEYSLQEQRRIIGSVFSDNQSELRMNYADEFYRTLKGLMSTKDDRFLRVYSWLQPFGCRMEGSNRTEKFIKSTTSISPGLLKSLKIQIQEDRRCRKIITTARSANKVL